MITEKQYIFISLIVVSVVIPYVMLYVFDIKIIHYVFTTVLSVTAEPFIILYALFVILYWKKSISAIKRIVKHLPLLNIPGLVLYWYFVVHDPLPAGNEDFFNFVITVMPLILVVSLVWLYISVFIVLFLDKKIYQSK